MDDDRFRTETEESGLGAGQPKKGQSESERDTVRSQPVRADSAEAQPESPQRDSGALREAAGRPAGSSRRGIRNADVEPDRDELTARADPTDAGGSSARRGA